MKRIYPNELMKTDAIKCKCGCNQNFYNPKLVTNLLELSESIYLSLPISSYSQRVVFYITSWNRCQKHNKTIKGASKNSLHLTGDAVDFVAAIESNSLENLIPVEVLSWFLNNLDQDLNEIITYEKGRVHFGISDNKVRGDKR